LKKVTVYTDGSCSVNPGPGGFGAILIFENSDGKSVEKEISGGFQDTTNNRMELTGPIEALKLLKEKCDVNIYSDSAYVVNCFDKGWIYGWAKNNWKKKDGELKNVDLLQELYRLCSMHNVTWNKVKGHSDNTYNNRCDELAVNETTKMKSGKFQVIQNENISEHKRDEFYDGELFEKKLGTKEIYKGRVFSVQSLNVELPNGATSTRDIVVHNGGAAIAALDDENNIYLVEQYRIAVEKTMLEIPAGKLEINEDPYECAGRELTEETGMIASEIEHIMSLNPTPGYCSETLYIYLAKGLKAGKPFRDKDEYLHIKKYNINDVIDMINKGDITDAKTIAAVLYIKAGLSK